jgi:hypothetical protein
VYEIIGCSDENKDILQDEYQCPVCIDDTDRNQYVHSLDNVLGKENQGGTESLEA